MTGVWNFICKAPSCSAVRKRNPFASFYACCFQKNKSYNFLVYFCKRRWIPHKGLQLFATPTSACPPLSHWLNAYSYWKTAALSGQPAQGGGALQHRRLTSAVVTQISLNYLCGRTMILFHVFFFQHWLVYRTWMTLNVLDYNFTIYVFSEDYGQLIPFILHRYVTNYLCHFQISVPAIE